MLVKTTKPFLRDLKKLSQSDIDAVIDAMKLFMSDAQTKSLNFEKVNSRSGYFTIRGSYSIRVLLLQQGKNEFDAVAVGNHDYIYASYFKR